MRKKTALAAMLVVMALTLGASTAFAQDVVWIYPFAEEPVSMTSGDQLRIFYYWLANTKGQEQVFVNHTSMSLVLAGSEGEQVLLTAEGSRVYYGPIETYTADNSVLDCQKPTYSLVYWEFTTPPLDLDPGEYNLVALQTFDNPVNDGSHVCRWVETGERYVQPPSLYRGSFTYVTPITVLP